MPDGPTSDVDPRREELQGLYLEWVREVKRYRATRWILLEEKPELHPVEFEKCRRDPLYFITVYCWLYEVREDQGSGSSFVPAVPFPFQFDLIRWMQRRMDARGAGANGSVSKSRDMGATWFSVLYVLWRFLFTAPFTAKLISRREDLVDEPGNMDSMMERIASNLERLPEFLLPPGWNLNTHRRYKKITRPDNKNMINGESTSSRSGRGGRATLILVDEIMFIAKIKSLLASIIQTAPHVIGLSSESVEFGDDYVFYRDALKEREPDAVLEQDYWMHPFHDEQWLTEQREKYGNDEGAFAREVLRQPWAGLSTLLYPAALDIRPLVEPWEWEPTTSGHINLDPGFDDECTFNIIAENYVPGRDLVFDGFEARQLPPEFYAAVIMGLEEEVRGFGAPPMLEAEAVRLARQFRELPEMPVYGDPAGAQRTSGESWYDKMILYSLEHNWRKRENGRPKPLVIEVNFRRNRFSGELGRRSSMMLWLPRLDFNQNPQAIATLTALQKSRLDEPGSRGRVAEQRNARHDQFCVTGDTRIRTLQGWIPIEDLIGRDDVYVWSYSDVMKRIVPAKVSDAFLSARDAEIVEVGLDDGTSIRCTPNHLFMLRDGSWCEAGSLDEGTSLMPFYERGKQSDYQIIDLNDGSQAIEHKYVYNWFHGPPPSGWHIHHKDEDKTNNDPSNLEALSVADHCRITLSRRYKDKEALSLSAKKASATAKSRHRQQKTCAFCQEVFMGDWRSIYCNRQCANKANGAGKLIEQQKSFVEKECKVCGAMFRGAPRRRTCSPECVEKNRALCTREYLNRRKQGIAAQATNHKVTFVRPAGRADVYDLTVPEYHNFVAEGVVIHNSHRRTAMEFSAVRLDERRQGDKMGRAKPYMGNQGTRIRLSRTSHSIAREQVSEVA